MRADQIHNPVESTHTGVSLLRCGAFFFLVLFSYNLLRGVREAMGVQGGFGDLRWLFLATLVVMAGANLLFGRVVSRIARSLLVPVVYRFSIACLLIFATTLLIGEGEAKLWIGYAFYIWLSVFNLFAMSVFWIVMLDAFPLERAKRAFPVIGIGGTLGALCGSAATLWFSQGASGLFELFSWNTGQFLAPLLFLIAASCLAIASHLGMLLHRAVLCDSRTEPRETNNQQQPIGGASWDGVISIARSPYLSGIALYICMIAVSSTVLYFIQANIVMREETSLHARIGLFSGIDLATQGLTLLTQAFVTSALLRKVGAGWTLVILPALTLVGLTLLWIAPSYGVLVIVQALHRAARYALTRPARETLFSVLDSRERQKPKAVIDTLVYRAGDAAGLVFSVITVLSAVLLIVAPLAAFWAMLAIALGRAQRAQDRESTGDPEPPILGDNT